MAALVAQFKGKTIHLSDKPEKQTHLCAVGCTNLHGVKPGLCFYPVTYWQRQPEVRNLWISATSVCSPEMQHISNPRKENCRLGISFQSEIIFFFYYERFTLIFLLFVFIFLIMLIRNPVDRDCLSGSGGDGKSISSFSAEQWNGERKGVLAWMTNQWAVANTVRRDWLIFS